MKTTLQLETLACPTCASKIETALLNTKGVNTVKVLYNASKAKIEYDADLTEPEKLAQIVKNLGYDVERII